MTAENRPSWLTEPCPPWCVRKHRDDDHPEDRFHQSEGLLVPVLCGAVDARLDASTTPTTLLVRQVRYPARATTWIDIAATESPRPRLVLSADSARLLTEALADLLHDDAG